MPYSIRADTPEEARTEIVKWLNNIASNHRIAAARAVRVRYRVEQTTLAAAHEGAARFIENITIEGSNGIISNSGTR